MLLLLRIWVGLVAAIAVVNAVQCFLDGQYPQKMIYTLQPHEGLWWGAWRFQPCPILTPSSYYPHPPTSFSLSPPQLHPSLPECLECGHCWLQWREVHLQCIHTARGKQVYSSLSDVWPNPPTHSSSLPSYSLFLVTFSSFLVAFLHFASEIFLYGTADLAAGSILPLIVSGQ